MSSQFFWFELLTVDLERSLTFWASVLDCDVARTDDESPAYFMMAKGTDSPLFGVVGIEPDEGVESHWIGYLMVADVDQAVDKTTEAGGLLHAVPEAGEEVPHRFAIVTDPQGAVVNLHETVPGRAPGEGLPELGRLAWIELLTNDREAAAQFYRELVGWEVGPEHPRDNEGVAHALFRDGRIFGLMRDLPAGSPLPPNWAFYLRVADLDEAIERGKAAGGFMFEEPAAVDGGRRVLMREPTGALVALWASL